MQTHEREGLVEAYWAWSRAKRNACQSGCQVFRRFSAASRHTVGETPNPDSFDRWSFSCHLLPLSSNLPVPFALCPELDQALESCDKLLQLIDDGFDGGRL